MKKKQLENKNKLQQQTNRSEEEEAPLRYQEEELSELQNSADSPSYHRHGFRTELFSPAAGAVAQSQSKRGLVIFEGETKTLQTWRGTTDHFGERLRKATRRRENKNKDKHLLCFSAKDALFAWMASHEVWSLKQLLAAKRPETFSE